MTTVINNDSQPSLFTGSADNQVTLLQLLHNDKTEAHTYYLSYMSFTSVSTVIRKLSDYDAYKAVNSISNKLSQGIHKKQEIKKKQ